MFRYEIFVAIKLLQTASSGELQQPHSLSLECSFKVGPLPMGSLVAALICNQWKPYHEFPHTRTKKPLVVVFKNCTP